jgi:uncharacterized membrane protein YedE/YeeE
MIGAGMALTGTCPGTVFVQIATGIPSGKFSLIGGALGGIIYSKFSNPNTATQSKENDCEKLTISKALNIDPNIALLAFEALCVIGITVANEHTTNEPGLMNPIIGGLCIGGGQLASVVLTRRSVGISSCFEEFGNWVWRLLDAREESSKERTWPSYQSMTFAAGVVAGAYGLATFLPRLILPDITRISPPRSIVGGMIMVIGSRIAGGCTSGHGISGVSLLSISSIYTVMAIFGGGIVLAAFLPS